MFLLASKTKIRRNSETLAEERTVESTPVLSALAHRSSLDYNQFPWYRRARLALSYSPSYVLRGTCSVYHDTFPTPCGATDPSPAGLLLTPPIAPPGPGRTMWKNTDDSPADRGLSYHCKHSD
ncbi:hypothetical protein DPEC_G00235560 [Dallia pectoralis]|uniref:Uncharacterized protein n=1 Tax=Dallia pectoralis TaxID=75939 RepID=A0ACC2FYG5_DALPE|nr:hypothetical protein DPEC_G00235560 [Dallia pectoralis]